jgi:hypothetical protein
MKAQIKIFVFAILMIPSFFISQENYAFEKSKLTNLFSARTLTIDIGSASRNFIFSLNLNDTIQAYFKKKLSMFDKTPVLYAALFDQNRCKIVTQKPNLAFFCAMENKFRNRFNVYLKLRAGNDEVYRDLISTISSK